MCAKWSSHWHQHILGNTFLKMGERRCDGSVQHKFFVIHHSRCNDYWRVLDYRISGWIVLKNNNTCLNGAFIVLIFLIVPGSKAFINLLGRTSKTFRLSNFSRTDGRRTWWRRNNKRTGTRLCTYCCYCSLSPSGWSPLPLINTRHL